MLTAGSRGQLQGATGGLNQFIGAVDVAAEVGSYSVFPHQGRDADASRFGQQEEVEGNVGQQPVGNQQWIVREKRNSLTRGMVTGWACRWDYWLVRLQACTLGCCW